MSDVLVFHRIGDGHEVHVVKADMVEWYKDDGGVGTRISEINGGFRVVKETEAEVTEAFNKP